MILDNWLTDASASVTIGTVVFAVWRNRRDRWRRQVDQAKAQMDKWQSVAENLEQANDDLRDQIRDLRTVALVDERINARLNTRMTDDEKR